MWAVKIEAISSTAYVHFQPHVNIGFKYPKSLGLCVKIHFMLDMCLISDGTYRYRNLSQDVLLDGFAFLDDLLVEFIQRRIHQLHADPNVPLEDKTQKRWNMSGIACHKLVSVQTI